MIIGTEDVSVDETVLKVVSAELNLYPVDKDKLRGALEAELEQFRGDTNAVSFKVFYDRREGGSPAFGRWDWAPEGDWSNADEGDRQTWDDYEWNEPDLDKFESPESCAPPGEDELILSGAYYDRPVETPSENTTGPDPDVMDEVAEEVGTTVELLSEALSKTRSWTAC